MKISFTTVTCHDGKLPRGMTVTWHVADYKFLKIKKKSKKFHSLTCVMYEHDVNSNLTVNTKLNHFQ